MPMIPALLQATMFASLQTQLQTQFPEALTDPTSAANQIKLANAISAAVAPDTITHIQSNALVTTIVNGATLSGPPGGPLPIVGIPGTGTVA